MAQEPDPKPKRHKRPYTTSDASIAAAQANGRLSMGPRSKAARQAVAMRALQDGVFAKTPVLDGESQADFDALVDSYIAETGAESKIEQRFAYCAALADWRLKRLMHAEADILRRQVHDAECASPEGRTLEVARLAKLLYTDPYAAVARLRETKAGAKYLLDQWHIISHSLTVQDGIWKSEFPHVIRLIGKSFDEMFTCESVEEWCIDYLASWRREGGVPVDLELAHRLFDPFRPSSVAPAEFDDRLQDWLKVAPSCDEGLWSMRQKIDRAINELCAMVLMFGPEEDVRRDMDIGTSSADDSLKSARRLRSEKEFKKEMVTMVQAVAWMRKARNDGVFGEPVQIVTPPHVAATARRRGRPPSRRPGNRGRGPGRAKLRLSPPPRTARPEARPAWASLALRAATKIVGAMSSRIGSPQLRAPSS